MIRYVIGITLTAVALLWFAGWNFERGRTEVLADWSASQVLADAAVRQLESTWQGRVETAGIEANGKITELAATAGRVAADNDRLRRAAGDAAKRAECANATTSEGAGRPANLLADVLSRAATRAGELAAYADRERIAREECQAAWPK